LSLAFVVGAGAEVEAGIEAEIEVNLFVHSEMTEETLKVQ
jgi:hypothetical protein